MARRLIERRTIVLVLSLLLLASGTPQVLARDAAQDALIQQALDARVPQPTDEPFQTIGTPPDDDLARALTLPTASGANPPYPANHTFDADQRLAGTPPTNHDIETPGYPVGLPPANFDLEAPSQLAGTPPANHDLASGDLTGWTTSGTVTVASDAGHGSFAQLGASGQATTSAFTVDPSTQAVAVEIGFLTATGASTVYVYARTGSGYTTSVYVGFQTCTDCNRWETRYLDVSALRGQSIQLQFTRTAGTIGIDAPRAEVLFADMTTSGPVSRVTEPDGNDYARLATNAVIITSPFVVDTATQSVAVRALDAGPGGQFWIDILSGPGFATSTRVHINGNAPDVWEKIAVNAGAWQGQTIKLRVEGRYKAIGVDDLGTQRVDLPGWTITGGDAWLNTEGTNSYVVAGNGTSLTTAAFVLDPAAQNLSLRYRAETGAPSFFPELLRGPDFSEVVNLTGSFVAASSQTEWTTLTVGIGPYAGETVKLRVRANLGRMQYDDVGVVSAVVPAWTPLATVALVAGEDSHGSYIQALSSGGVRLRSSDIATGIVDSDAFPQARFYAISYDTTDLLKVTWTDRATGASWVVFQDASSTGTGYRTSYFPLHDSKGADGYFEIQVPYNGKVYAIADNIARQHLNEPFSESVGAKTDTATGSFGYQAEDLRTAGFMPLQLVRYYSGHSDQYGPLGYRWTHTYETHLVLASNDDAGVVLGSGREVFYDGNLGQTTFTPVDPRVHDTLVKNVDGSFDWTTTSNLVYHFDAAGTLLTISDLNGNTITLARDASGRLASVTDPVGRAFTFAYDANDRLASVTDPLNAVVEYSYDVNGDLTTVTDPLDRVWTYTYDLHRLVSVTGPDAVTQFSNTFDDAHRVTTQTLADASTIQIDYATPALGVTSVTDPEGKTARYYADRYGRTTHKVDSLNHVTEYQYDADGNRARVLDPLNNAWGFTYDTGGNLSDIADPHGNPLGITYTAQHLPASVTDSCGNTTLLTYDADGNIATTTDALNNLWQYTYNSRGQVLTETNPLNQVTTYTYDSQGNQTSKTDALNHIWTWTYDANGQVLTETDPNNHTTTYAYDLNGKLTLIRDHLGHEIERFYDLYGYLLWEEDQLNQRTNWQYDERGNVVMKQDPAGKQWHYTWDTNGRMLSQTDPNQHTTTYSYDAGRLVAVTNHLNETTTRSYDAAGRLATITDPLNRVMSFGYDASGRLVSTTLPNGGVNTSTYDDCGNLLTTTDALGQTTTYTYDAAGRLLTETDPLLGVTTHAYDATGRQTSVTDPLNRTTTYGYDPAGNQTTVTDPLNQTTTSTYDALNRLTAITDPLNQTTSYSYDAAGQRTRVTLPSGTDLDYVYDARGLLLSVTDALTHATTYTYDAAGRKLTETDANQHTTTHGYDAADRQTTMTDALGGVVTMAYDAAGRMTSLTDPRGKTRTYTYTALGAVLTETDPLNRTTTNSYDLAGRLTGTTDPRGVSVSYGYDAANNLTSVTYPGGTIAYVYDDLGRRTSMTDATGTTTTTYDAASQILSEAAPQGTVSYDYDDTGRRTKLTAPGNRWLDYGYDAASRLTSVTDWQNQVTSYTYTVDGLTSGIHRPNGIDTNYGYDLAGRLTSLRHFEAATNTTLQQYSYTLDNAGNRTAVSGSVTETYTLDALNRLTNVTYTNGDSAAYVYDAAGNRTSQTLTIGGIPDTTLFTYDDAGQLTQAGLTTYSYDLAGNLTSTGGDTYSWDWAGQLTSATVNGTTTDFTYDGDGIRVGETTNSVTTSQVWDRAGGLQLLVANGATTYVHGANGLVSEVNNAGVTTYHHADALGSIRGLTDSTGTLTGTAEYGAFGEARSSTGTQSQFGYTGEQTETTTGNVFLRARSYDPDMGRFLSADTVQPNAPGTQGYNRYAYTANNPTTWTDPSGHSVSDAMAWVDDLQRMGEQLAAVATALGPLLIGLSGLGMLAFGPALLAVMGIFLLIAQILLGMTLLLNVLDDPFQYYRGENPTGEASGEHPEEQTETPPLCGFENPETDRGYHNMVNSFLADGNATSDEKRQILECGRFREFARLIIFGINAIGMLISVATVGYILGSVAKSCSLGFRYTGHWIGALVGCGLGLADATRKAGATRALLLGMRIELSMLVVPLLLECLTAPSKHPGSGVSAGCFESGLFAAAGFAAGKLAGPLGVFVVDMMATCRSFRGSEGISDCFG